MDATKKKQVRRVRRKKHIRKNLQGTASKPRLSVFRSLDHIYCQAIDDENGVTLVSASSQSKEIRGEIGKDTGNVKGAEMVGALFAQKAKDAGLSQFSFDRNGRKYHGRVAAIAEAIRKEGIQV